MRVYLDDERKTPQGWQRVYTAYEAIGLLRTGLVTEISLDHDLGNEKIVGNGYIVIKWLEEQVYNGIREVPIIHIHTANNVAGYRMEQALKNILRLTQEGTK